MDESTLPAIEMIRTSLPICCFFHLYFLYWIKAATMTYISAGAHSIRNQSATHVLTFSIMGWIDIFSHQKYRDLVLESFTFCRKKKNLLIGAYVIMTNHIHVIWTAPDKNLSDIIRDFKTFTSKAITSAVQEETESRRNWLLYMFRYYANGTNANDYFKVWSGRNCPEALYAEQLMRQKLDYIHQNPVRAGIVTEPEHYLYSSAADYCGKKGLIEIDVLF